jgi:Domain of unknown function (DUF4149)
MHVVTLLYHLALAFWVGGVALFTFILTPILFKTQPRDLAGKIVGVLFPGYFRWGLGCGGIALLCLLILGAGAFIPALIILLLMLAATLFQALFIEPRAKALKQQIGSFETTPKEHPLRREFSKLHGISAVCNLAVFVGGVVLIVFQ